MQIEVSDKITIRWMDGKTYRFLCDNYTIKNPEYITRKKLKKWIGNTPKTIRLFTMYNDDMATIPYGALPELMEFVFNNYELNCLDVRVLLNKGKTADWSGESFTARPYQRTAVDEMKKWKCGILKAPCSAGKTIMGHILAQETGMKTLWLTHTRDLLEQSKAIGVQMLGKDRVGTITEGKARIGSTITYATVQTLAKMDVSLYRDEWNCVIVDECFPGDTLIRTNEGYKRLNLLSIGDIVASYNVKQKKLEYKKVRHIFKNVAHDLVSVKLRNGEEVVCTSNHPFYTQDGWKSASTLGGCDYVMQLLPEGDRCKLPVSIKKIKLQEKGVRLLLRGVCKKVCTGKGMDGGKTEENCGKHAKNKRGVSRTNSCPDERKQPDEIERGQREGFEKAERNRSSSENQMRKRYWADSSTADANVRIGKNDGGLCRIPNPDKNENRLWLSNVLQSRHSNTRQNVGYRGRREYALPVGKAKTRQEKGSAFKWVGVDCVKVQKQTSDGTFGGMCKDGFVYNIEVEDNHNYFVKDVLVHNCHRCNTKDATARMSYVVNHIKAQYKYGLSATPETHDGYFQTILCNLGQIRHEISKEELEDNGSIMPVTVKKIETRWVYPKESKKANGVIDFDKAVEFLRKDEDRNRLIVSLIKGRPTLILSNSVDHLVYIMNELSPEQQERACLISTKHDESLVTADKVLRKHTAKQRRICLDKMRNGELDIMLSTYQLAKEGLNIQRLEQVIMAFPAVDANIITQTVGRVARTCEGKSEAICYDLVDYPKYFDKKWGERRRLYIKNGNPIK